MCFTTHRPTNCQRSALFCTTLITCSTHHISERDRERESKIGESNSTIFNLILFQRGKMKYTVYREVIMSGFQIWGLYARIDLYIGLTEASSFRKVMPVTDGCHCKLLRAFWMEKCDLFPKDPFLSARKNRKHTLLSRANCKDGHWT